MWSLRIHVVEKRREAVGEVCRREGFWRIRGRAGPRRIPGDNPKLVRELCQLAFPTPRITKKTMEEHQLLAMPRLPINNSNPVDFCCGQLVDHVSLTTLSSTTAQHSEA